MGRIVKMLSDKGLSEENIDKLIAAHRARVMTRSTIVNTKQIPRIVGRLVDGRMVIGTHRKSKSNVDEGFILSTGLSLNQQLKDEIISNKGKARRLLMASGIIDATGKLSKNYTE